MFVERSNGKSHLKQEGRIMSNWVDSIFKRVERFTGYNWLEFLDERVRPAARQSAQRCLKYGIRCVNWIKINAVRKNRGIRR